MGESRSKSVLGGKKSEKKSEQKKKSKTPHEIHVRKGASGGFIAKHHFESNGDESVRPEEHVIPDKQQLLAHMDENFPEEAGEMQQGGGEPQGAASVPQVA
jgi:hypothetical protein